MSSFWLLQQNAFFLKLELQPTLNSVKNVIGIRLDNFYAAKCHEIKQNSMLSVHKNYNHKINKPANFLLTLGKQIILPFTEGTRKNLPLRGGLSLSLLM